MNELCDNSLMETSAYGPHFNRLANLSAMQSPDPETAGEDDISVPYIPLLAEMNPLVSHVRSELGPFNFDQDLEKSELLL